MEQIKAPKKERKFLKAIGKIGKALAEELVMGIGRKFIGKVVDKVKIGKRERLSLLFLLSLSFSFASIDSIPYPITGNKQRLGFNTTGNGLVWRGLASDTVTKPTSYVDKNVKAYLVLDSITGALFFWKQNKWATAMPFDSITFNTAKDGTVGIGEVEYNDSYGSLIQGLKGGNVTNIIGQQLHQRVTNNTGSVLSKGTAVYLSGSQGNRITVAKALATSDPTSANTFGIVAESIADNANGYIITEGLIMGINTSGLVEDSAVYLSPTVAGGLTSTKPQAPNHGVYIGVCVKSNAGSGELFVKIKNGLELDELHDVLITSPVANASLYYKGGLWRDTTAALLVSDTATMLANYATKAYADTSGRFYARQDFTNVSSATLTWTQSDTLVVGGVNVVQVYRNGQILLPTQYTIPTNASVVIGATAYKVGENYTVIFPRGGGAGSGGGGSGSLTSISGGTGITVSPNPITTTGTVSADLSILMELTDTSLLNLNTRFASKLNAADTASLSNRINAKGTVSSVATGYGLSGGTITTTGTLVLDSATVFTRIRDSIVDVAIGNDTIKILKQEYPAQSSAILNWTVTSKFPIQLKAFILVFRNGQLLINTQYNLTDTNKITIVSNSFKVGANYTVVTVSGIGSVGTGVFPNPVYPEAGIALSTGSAWASSIPNNSTNWNIAFNDKINNAAFSGTTTKTLTLTQYDGGTLTAPFTDLQGVTGSGTINYIPKFSTTTEVTNSVIQESSNNIGINTTPFASLTMAQGKNIMLDASSNNISKILFYETNARNENDVQFGAKIQYNSPSDRLEFIMRDSFSADPSGDELAISIVRQTGNTTIHKDLTVTGNITEGGNNVLTNLDTASLSSRIDSKFNSSGGTISGAVTLSTTTATPTVLLGKDSSNVVGQLYIDGGLSIIGSNLYGIKPSYSSITGTSATYSSNYMNTVNALYIKVNNNSTVTITLPSATSQNGKSITVKNLGTGAVISNASNVEPFNSATLGTSILSSGGGKWATLVSDGTNWIIMQSN